MRTRSERWAWWGVGLATAVGVFALPFCFPLKTAVFSETYMAGADNRVAAVAVAVIGLVVLWWRWRRGKDDQDAGGELGWRWLWGGILLASLATAWLGWLVVRADAFWGDEGYFVEQLRTGVLFHRLPYRDFEFPYGPLLYWWGAGFVRGLSGLGVSVPAAYLVSLGVMQAVGLGILFHVEQLLTGLRTIWKRVSFGLIAAASVTPVMGLNYTLVRFVLPLAFALWLGRARRVGWALGIALLGEVVLLGVSPELGVAFGVGCLLYGGVQAVKTGWRWGMVPVAAVVGAGVFAAIVGRDYFLVAARISGGEYNLLIQPVPYVLLLLVAAVGLAPLAVAGRAWLLPMYGVALGLLPAALGRCDPIHTFFNGIGLYLLACVAVQGATRRVRWGWGGALGIVLVLAQIGNFHLYRRRLELVVRAPERLEDRTIDAVALEKLVGSGGLSAPRSAPLWLEQELTRAGVYRPGYYRGVQGVWDQGAERRLIAGMRGAEFALVPVEGMLAATEVSVTGWRRRVGLGWIFHARRPAYVQGALVEEELRGHWVAVAGFGTYVLWRKVS